MNEFRNRYHHRFSFVLIEEHVLRERIFQYDHYFNTTYESSYGTVHGDPPRPEVRQLERNRSSFLFSLNSQLVPFQYLVITRIPVINQNSIFLR